jgi:TetR/AcrR family transcriptional regulator
MDSRISATAEPPAPIRTRGGEANVERILDAALAVFSAHGFGGARVEAIAAAAGLSKTNLLYYFRTKADLYLAVLRRTLDMWLEPLRSIRDGDDPRAAVASYVTRKLEFARDHSEASRLFAMEIMRGAPILDHVLATELKALFDEKAALIERWMMEGSLPAAGGSANFLFLIWATTQHYADFAAQVRALTGGSLRDPAFFAQARLAVLRAVLGR